ncbi:MAG: DUF2948 family protein [Alphaproteobacteria bacterium]
MVRLRGLNRAALPKSLDLLTIASQRTPQGGVSITLLCAAGGGTRRGADTIARRLEEMSEPWPATLRPNHHRTDQW